MKRGLVWFTEDMRLDDNEVLLQAIKENDEVLPVVFYDPNVLSTRFLNIDRTSSNRLAFFWECVEDLRSQLKSIGGNLHVEMHSPSESIKSLCVEYEIRKVYTKKQVGSEEKFMQNQVKDAIRSIGVDFETYSTSTLYHPDDLPFSIRDIPMLYTKFRKRAEQEAQIRLPFDPPVVISVPKITDVILPKIESTKPSWLNGGETRALKRMSHYLWETQKLGTYKLTRDHIQGLDNSSKFSAWLSLGCISPRRLFQEIQKFESKVLKNESTYWLVFELIWRDFFRFCLKKHAISYFLIDGLGHEPAPFKSFNPKLFEAWTQGRTQEPFINAGMNELRITGFVSNRMRQILASYWIYGLKQNWMYGAAWFESQLVDYDVASNWGNWAYIAGVGNDARGGREFNLEKQQSLYDKSGEYQLKWLK